MGGRAAGSTFEVDTLLRASASLAFLACAILRSIPAALLISFSLRKKRCGRAHRVALVAYVCSVSTLLARARRAGRPAVALSRRARPPPARPLSLVDARHVGKLDTNGQHELERQCMNWKALERTYALTKGNANVEADADRSTK